MTEPGLSGAPKVLVGALIAQIVLGAILIVLVAKDFDLNGPDEASAAQVPRAKAQRFDERRAFALLRKQVEDFGHRPAGSPALRRLARHLRTRVPGGRFEKVPGHRGLRNVVWRVPGRGRAVVIGAHYDVEARPKGFVGANDGAAGTAAVVELARVMRKARRPSGSPPLHFVLFDGEEEPAGCEPFEACGLRGSKAFVKRHRRGVRAMVLLDYVANKDLRIPREGTSDEALWQRLRASARRVGVLKVFPDSEQTALFDDHTPFLQEGIPAIDLIDFSYRHRDTLRDTVDKTSARSLDAVGETVADLLLHWPG